MNGEDFVKDTYIPIFTNKHSDYREWRQQILLYKRKSDLNKKWKQIEGIAEKAAESEDGFMMILNELDKTLEYNDQVEMPRAFEKFFFELPTRRSNNDQLLWPTTVKPWPKWRSTASASLIK